jgi:molybdenum cofactor cytidylyltransferase
MMTIAAMILAAGTSSRYGANKLLLPFGSGTVISTVVSTLAQTPVRPLVVVTGHQRAEVEAALQVYSSQIEFAHNPDYRAGEMLSSIKTGVRHLLGHPAAPDALFVVLGDQPRIRHDVVERLCAAFEQGCGELITPRLGLTGPRGHPVLIARAWWEAVLALPSQSNVRELLRANQRHLTHLVVNTDSILTDVDTPEAYREALAKQGVDDGRPTTDDGCAHGHA